MKLTKNSNILLLGLSLILSIVSFTGVVSHLPTEATKSGLIVSDYSEDTRFSIKYQNANKDAFVSFLEFSNHSFIKFKNVYDLKEIIAFKTYTNNTLSLREEQLQTKLYSFAHKTLYYDIV